MESAVETYLEKCQTIFKRHLSKLSKVVPFPVKKQPTRDYRQFFEKAIKEAEDTEEFVAFAKALGVGALAAYLEKMTKKEERRKKKRQGNPRDIDKIYQKGT